MQKRSCPEPGPGPASKSPRTTYFKGTKCSGDITATTGLLLPLHNTTATTDAEEPKAVQVISLSLEILNTTSDKCCPTTQEPATQCLPDTFAALASQSSTLPPSTQPVSFYDLAPTCKSEVTTAGPVCGHTSLLGMGSGTQVAPHSNGLPAVFRPINDDTNATREPLEWHLSPLVPSTSESTNFFYSESCSPSSPLVPIFPTSPVLSQDTTYPDPSDKQFGHLDAGAQSPRTTLLKDVPQTPIAVTAKSLLTPKSLSSPSSTEQGMDMGPYYGLPDIVRVLIAKYRGITELYPWQHHVLQAMKGRSFLFSLPTSSGKTLVAEIALLQSLMLRKKSALLVLPFISIAEEKKEGLERFGTELGFGVHGYYGVNGRFPVPKAPVLMVCTIEKGNSVVNHLSEEGRLEELGTVVVDELHMLGEDSRGATLEILMTKLRFACPHVQIVGMSATIPNLNSLADWLGAGLYEHNYRPVPLKEFVKVDQQVYDVDHAPVRIVPSTAEDPHGLLHLICEVCPESSILIFCATKSNCQDCATAVCKFLPEHFLQIKAEDKQQLLQDLRSCSDVSDPTLQATVPYGVAYHHSGLTMEERELLERAFRSHVITLLCCTSTLAAGVNLPAKRVIFRTPYVGRSFLTKSRYMQMAGRAGRKGCDPYGESYLLLHPKDAHAGWALISQGLEPCMSQLTSLGCTADTPAAEAEKCVLEVVAAGFVKCREELLKFIEHTCSYHQAGDSNSKELFAVFCRVLDSLIDAKLVEEEAAPEMADIGDPNSQVPTNGSVKSEDVPNITAIQTTVHRKLGPTPFGLSAYKANFTIKEANFARSEFERLLENGLILSDELHLCYLVTPFRDLMTPDWSIYLAVYHQMSATRQRISQMIGISEGLLVSRSVDKGTGKKHHRHREKIAHDELVLKRFFAALVLCDLVNETPMARVEAKYKLNRGTLQSLLKSSQVFANMMVNFSSSMGWYSLERVLAGYVKRLGFGVKPDLVPLIEIKGVQAARARALWNAGYRQVKDIAKADVEALLLRMKMKCRSTRMLSRKAAQQIIESARALLQDQAKELKEEAEQLLAPD